jgi:hypothetical protein
LVDAGSGKEVSAINLGGNGNVIPAGLEALMRRAGDPRGAPPVDAWDPPFCGDIDMRIEADGTWCYLGTPIGRPALVRLFASILRRDADGRTFLVTPVEKCGIRIEDAPFLGVELHADGTGTAQRLTFRTNVGDVVEAGPEHPLRFEIEPATGGLKPYLHVRGRLEALINRAVTHQLIDLAEEAVVESESTLGIWSNGRFFAIVTPD